METVGGGVRTHVLQLLKNLDPERYELTLIYGERYDHVFESQREELAKHVTLILDPNLVRSADLRASWKAVKSLRATLRRIKPDIVHCHSSIAGLVGRAAAKLEHVPKIFYTPHAYAFDAPEFSAKKRAVFGLAERVMSRWATTRTFNVSEGEYRSALSHHIDKPSKFAVIHNGVPELQLPPRTESRHRLGLDDLVPQDVPIVGVAAWLDARKDPMTFVRIAERVHDDGRNVHFVYIGSGELQDQVRLIILKDWYTGLATDRIPAYWYVHSMCTYCPLCMKACHTRCWNRCVLVCRLWLPALRAMTRLFCLVSTVNCSL